MSGAGTQAEINAAVWREGDHAARYDHDTILGAEAMILARHREAMGGRVLDVGCGAGRMLAYLLLLGAEVHGLDLSPLMVAHCRARFPGVDVHLGDLGDLRATETGPFDAILIPDNTLDVFGVAERRRVLVDLRGLLAPAGLLVFTAHNLDCWDREGGEPRVHVLRRVLDWIRGVARPQGGSRLHGALAPLRARRNRRRLAPLQSRADDHAVFNDSAHEFSLLHLYIGAAAQRRQLAELGYTTVEVLEVNGTPVPADAAGRSPWLHYVARVAPDAGVACPTGCGSGEG